MSELNSEGVKIDLPDAETLLGEDYNPLWDYVWVLPTSLPKLMRLGFVAVAEPIDFYYGAQMMMVGRLRKES